MYYMTPAEQEHWDHEAWVSWDRAHEYYMSEVRPIEDAEQDQHEEQQYQAIAEIARMLGITEPEAELVAMSDSIGYLNERRREMEKAAADDPIPF